MRLPRLVAVASLTLTLGGLGCHSKVSPPDSPAVATPPKHPAWLPNPRLTPGATIPGVTVAQVCVSGYSSRIRNVTEADRKAIFVRDGVPWAERSKYEVDHLISLELGGSNEYINLWVQPGFGEWTYHEKDVLENLLHKSVCSGRLTLPVAQQMISGDWTKAYWIYVPVRTRAIGKPASEMGPEVP